MEVQQRADIFKVNCCLKVHNIHLKLTRRISGSAAWHTDEAGLV